MQNTVAIVDVIGKLSMIQRYIKMSVYFNTMIAAEQKCEVFCMEGVPAASIIHNGTNSKGEIIVDSFHLHL